MTLFRYCIITLLSISIHTTTLATTNEAPTVAEAPLPLEDLQLFTAIFDHIRHAYVEPVSDTILLENAIKGMLQKLDPHSNYLDKQHFTSLQENTQGEFTGVGIKISNEDGYIKIIAPIDGSPAKKAGIQAGDLIIKLNHQSIYGLPLDDVINYMRGKKGTTIIITIIRESSDKPIDIEVVRDAITTNSVTAELLNNTIGYLRIAQFQANTHAEFTLAIKQLYQQGPNIQGFILDLRNNPGGILQVAVDVADTLLDGGLIVYTEGRLPESNQSFNAMAGDITHGLPIVILINEGSASASEIVAGALQDQTRAIIVGTRSFGKGSVQTILPVGRGKGIKLTTALYFTPNGRSIQAQGIEPDIEVKPATMTLIDNDNPIKEANLNGHITQKEPLPTNQPISAHQPIYDNQLSEAMNILKGLSIFMKKQKP